MAKPASSISDEAAGVSPDYMEVMRPRGGTLFQDELLPQPPPRFGKPGERDGDTDQSTDEGEDKNRPSGSKGTASEKGNPAAGGAKGVSKAVILKKVGCDFFTKRVRQN